MGMLDKFKVFPSFIDLTGEDVQQFLLENSQVYDRLKCLKTNRAQCGNMWSLTNLRIGHCT